MTSPPEGSRRTEGYVLNKSSQLCLRHRKNLHLQSRDLSRRVSSAGTHLSAGSKTASSSVLFLRLLVAHLRVLSQISGRHTTGRCRCEVNSTDRYGWRRRGCCVNPGRCHTHVTYPGLRSAGNSTFLLFHFKINVEHSVAATK